MKLKHKKILVITSTFPGKKDDSIPRFVFDTARGIQSAENDCLVLAPHAKGLKKQENWQEVEIRRFVYMWPYSLEQISGAMLSKIKQNYLRILLVPFFLIAEFIYLVGNVIVYKPDVVVSSWMIPQGFICAIAKMFFKNTKFINIFYGMDVAWVVHFKILKWLVLGWAIKAFDELVCVSSDLKKKLCHMGVKNEIVVIPTAVDGERFKKAHKKTPGQWRLLFIGRLVEKKGVQFLIEAMPEVYKYCPEAVLKIAGNGPLENELKVMAKKISKTNIEFLGAVENSRIVDVFSETDILIVPSINTPNDIEGLPTVIGEAMAAKVAIIATDAGGIEDVIKDNETGLLVKQRDVKSLANAIIALIKNNEKQKEMAEKAYSLFSEYNNYQKVGERFTDLF